MNFLTSAVFLLALASLVRWGRHRESTWLSRDGTRFMARARIIDDRGGRPGRWMHIRGGIGRDALVIQPGFMGSGSVAGVYTAVSRLDGEHRGALLYVARGETSIVLRVQPGDRLAAALDSLPSQPT